jgi:hypothetical protein
VRAGFSVGAEGRKWKPGRLRVALRLQDPREGRSRRSSRLGAALHKLQRAAMAADDLGRDGEAEARAALARAALERLEQVIERLFRQARAGVARPRSASCRPAPPTMRISPGLPVAAMACRALRTRFDSTRCNCSGSARSTSRRAPRRIADAVSSVALSARRSFSTTSSAISARRTRSAWATAPPRGRRRAWIPSGSPRG